MSADRIPIRFTITGVYSAEPAHYDVTGAEAIAEYDQELFDDDALAPSELIEWADEYTVKLEPAVPFGPAPTNPPKETT